MNSDDLKLTKAQENFIRSVKPWVTYTSIGKRMRTAKALETLGLVTVGNGPFAFLTERGLDVRSKLAIPQD